MDPTTTFKCLADRTRLNCMLLLTEEAELCVCEFTAALRESQPKISRHLAQLKSCGLVADRRQGQWVFYRLNPALPQWLSATLKQLVAEQSDLILSFHHQLSQMGDRPERQASCC